MGHSEIGATLNTYTHFNFDDAVAARKEAEIKYFGEYRYKGDDEVGA